MKGYRGNAAGDGPIATREQSRRESIARNGFFLSKRRRHESAHGNQNNSPYFVSDISSPTIQQKFTSQTIPTLNDVILELNYDNIARYNYQYVISLLQRSDIYQIKFRNRNSSAITECTTRTLLNVDSQTAQTRGIYNFSRSYDRSGLTVFKSLTLEWDYENPCRFCGCIMYFVDDKPNVRKKCCNNGKIFLPDSNYPHLQALPDVLLEYCVARKNHMGRNSVSYNNILCLGATGCENETGRGGYETINGDHSFLLHGRMYHCLPDHNSKTGGLYFFTYDAIQQMQEHGDKVLNIRDESGAIKHYRFYGDIAANLYTELKINNYLVRECVAIGDHVRRQANLHLSFTTSAFDIASIISEDSSRPNRTIVFKLRNEIRPRNIQMTSKLMEPLCYPLLFPFGEDGWSTSISRSIKFYDYLLHRFLMPEKDSNGIILKMRSQGNPERLIPASRFQIMFRLGQIYLVDMISRIIDYRLAFHKSRQDQIFGGQQHEQNDNANNIEDQANEQEIGELTEEYTEVHHETDNSHDNIPKKTFLSQSLHGSRRHLLSLAHNALCLVSEYGRPTLFLTLTCNPYWKEIKDMLLEGETAYDRADVTNKVFHSKLELFLFNLRKGKYFGPQHKVIYEVRVIEYQQRGLPHAHIVVQLSNIPDYKIQRRELIWWIDENINCTLPEINENSDERTRQIHELIKSHMIHKCYQGCKNEKTGICEKGFSNTVLQDETTLDEHGYPLYKRVNVSDLKVVPHNTNILLDWNGHANVEYSGSSYCIIYLYKYLFKGRKKVSARVSNRQKNRDRPTDEIDAYVKGRYMCAMDAMWRTYGYQTYPGSIPAVNLVKVMLEKTAMDYLNINKQLTDIVVYFNRPTALLPLLYNQMFNEYSWSYKLLKTYVRQPALRDVAFWELVILPLNRPIYIMKKVNPNPSITRIGMLCILTGEIYYLRILMVNCPVLSWKDAKTFEGTEYNTFKEAAVARGLIDDKSDAVNAFKEMIKNSGHYSFC